MTLLINQQSIQLKLQNISRQTTNHIQSSMKRLASGLRINSASDDVGGLGIAVRLQKQVLGINASIKNSQDGINLSQTADSLLGEVESNLQKLRELSVQALNSTYNEDDLVSIQTQIDEIKQSIVGIQEQARFNDKDLFDGSFQNQRFQLGDSSVSSLFVSIRKLTADDLGRRVILKSETGVDTSGTLLDNDVNFFSLNGIEIRDSVAADDSISMTDNANSAIAKAAAINAAFEDTGVKAIVMATRTDEQQGLNDNLHGEDIFGNLDSIDQVQLTGSTYLEINGVNFSNFSIEEGDATGTLVKSINAAFDETGVTAEISSSGELVLEAKDGRNIFVDYYGDNDGVDLETLIGLRSGNFAADARGNAGFAYGGRILLESDGDLEADFDLDVNILLGNVAEDFNHINDIYFSATSEDSITNLDITSVQGRALALNTVDYALDQISQERSFFGALQNRFDATINTLESSKINLSIARSRIADADFAGEASLLLSNQIRSQTQLFLTSQANITPEIALTLLNSVS